MRSALAFVLAIALAALLAVGCGVTDARLQRADVVTDGNRARGRELISDLGCGSCHTVPGVKRATGLVGPPLNRFGSRSFIAGELANTPDNLATWIMNPQSVEPGTAMPDLGVTADQARDIVAYLEHL